MCTCVKKLKMETMTVNVAASNHCHNSTQQVLAFILAFIKHVCVVCMFVCVCVMCSRRCIDVPISVFECQ